MASRLRKRKATAAASGPGFARELSALVMIALGTVAVLSLVSFDAADDTLLSRNFDRTQTRNFIGPVGANLAAVMIQLFGYASFLLPAAMFAAGGCLALGLRLKAPMTKAIGSAGLLASLTLLLSLLLPHHFARWVPGGGVLGRIELDYLNTVLSDIGIAILALTAIAVSLLLTFRFSFAALLKSLGGATASALRGSGRSLKSRMAARRKRKSAEPQIKVRLKLGLPFFGKQGGRKTGRKSTMPATARQPAAPADPAPGEDEEFFEPAVVTPKATRRSEAIADRDRRLPPLALLDEPPQAACPLNLKMLAEQARLIVERYREFGVEGEILQTNPGPVVNTFEFRPAAGVKYSKVVSLADELCLALKAVSVRINRLPGKSTIGIEVPNQQRQLIHLREIIESYEFQSAGSPLSLALGKQIGGEPYVARLALMPHLLIAGATGTGKSVSLHTMICSILFKATAEEVRLLLIDPKQVELNYYNGIPHLLTPVVTSPKRAASALRWACEEMESRFRKLAAEGARNVEQYNLLAAQARHQYGESDEGEAIEPMPLIVIAIDELSDLMMVSSAEVEESICRLAQKARAVGIHLIVATQRPSVDVLTGVIKANFQCRISFRVATKVDSRTILDSNGAEQLLGDGDMLFLPPRSSRLIRLHGPFISEGEIKRVLTHLKADDGRQTDAEDIFAAVDERRSSAAEELAPARDPLFDEAVKLVLSTGVASISNLQRKMRLGYARAARIIDMMEGEGIVGPADGSKPRQILKKQVI